MVTPLGERLLLSNTDCDAIYISSSRHEFSGKTFGFTGSHPLMQGVTNGDNAHIYVFPYNMVNTC